MHIERNKSLKDYNTFSIDCKAYYFTSVKTIDQLKKVLKNDEHKERFILGGGSNILFTKDINELVIHIDLKGIKMIEENHEFIKLEVMAGENWHDFVLYCIDHDYGGIENLSLIPGNVGAAPIQNIGAYGVELKNVFESCKALSIDSLSERIFSNDDCHFDYRNSIFKSEEIQIN
jgi:UDP-N-acetylmuramate dehydrogenase